MSKTYPTRLVVRIVTVVLLLSVSLSAFAQQQFSVKLKLSDDEFKAVAEAIHTAWLENA